MNAGGRKHIIQKQVLEFRWDSPEKSRTVIDDLGEKFEKEIRPGIEKVFERLDREGQVIRLDKVEIDIGAITKGQFEQELGDLISEKLYEHLESKISSSEGGTMPADDDAEIISFPVSDTDAVVFFLEMGYFPWWSPFNTQKELAGKIKDQIKTGEEGFRERMAGVMADRNTAGRLISSIPAALLDELIQYMYPEIKFRPSLLIEGMLHSVGKKRGRKGISHFDRGYANMLALLSAQPKIKTGELIIRLMGEMVPGPVAKVKSIPELLERLKKWIETKDKETVSELRGIVDSLVHEISEGKTRIKEMTGEEVEKEGPRKQKEKKEDKVSKEHEKTMVTNSGLVLLWPYLEELFEELKYLEEKKFRSNREINRALLLLNSLVCGDAEREEHSMVLNKIICGVDTDFRVDLEVKLRKKELEEGEKMLEHFIKHWKKLKNTSPDGLREAFLRREGSLEPREENWKLTVERKAIDVLMGALPFQVSMIKLPWMPNMILVEW
jgi:hypothetical protein